MDEAEGGKDASWFPMGKLLYRGKTVGSAAASTSCRGTWRFSRSKYVSREWRVFRRMEGIPEGSVAPGGATIIYIGV